jgi:hypothetical protein
MQDEPETWFKDLMARRGIYGRFEAETIHGDKVRCESVTLMAVERETGEARTIDVPLHDPNVEVMEMAIEHYRHHHPACENRATRRKKSKNYRHAGHKH